ncbi:MAG TPA: hypothetical protein VGO11_12965 [Chthoniobacteraceae bacterium]|jgi:hypothetical protein|nr:hypothetical protein [Chthoniobacteraceae bacterium]
MPDPVYINICSGTQGFNIRTKSPRKGKPYPGAVVVSRDAIYFAINRDLIAAGAAAVGGATGGLLGGLIAGKTLGAERKSFLPQPASFVEETDLTNLPAEVVGHPDWPVKWQEGPVILVPRPAVRALRTSFWLGFEVELDTLSILVFAPVFQRKKLAAALVAQGWDVQGA